MTTRVQTLRSSTTQAVPAAGTRSPGELWTNFPDLQMGVIDAARNAQKLVAVRYFSTTANYAAGDCVWQGGKLYLANGPIPAGAFSVNQWTQIASMTDVGAISPMNDNKIINGDMRIDQRNNGAAVTPASNPAYVIDRWQLFLTQPSKLTLARQTSSLAGFPYCLAVSSASAYALAAADTFGLQQQIEADMVSDFAFGTASAQPVTLSFWAQSSLTGTFSARLANGAATRSYPFTFSIPVANTWTKIVVTIPGDTAAATWVLSGNAAGATIAFDLGSGATYRGTAGAWTNGNIVGVTGSVSVVTVNGASFSVTGVKLEIGSVATPYNHQSLAKSMADCERYFRWVPFDINFFAPGGGQNFQQSISFPSMRAAPTLSGITADPSQTQQSNNNSASIATNARTYGASLYVTASVGSTNTFCVGYRVSATAEL